MSEEIKNTPEEIEAVKAEDLEDTVEKENDAEAAINRYITDKVTPDTTPDIKVAALLLVGYYDYHRNMDKDMPSDGNYLPAPVRTLLWPYRKPTAI